MASTSPVDLARELYRGLEAGESRADNLLESLARAARAEDREMALAASRALFGEVAEAMADRFEPAMEASYADVFSRVLAPFLPRWSAGDLTARFGRLRQARRYDERAGRPRRVFVLSRVTLGADVAITGILLDASKKRFPDADIYFAGGGKAWGLFEADRRLQWLPLDYRRDGTLAERIEDGLSLGRELAGPDAILIDPDSRISQLGLLPVCAEERHFYFPSRSYGAGTADSLSQLAQRWAAETFGVVDALPYIAPVTPRVPAGLPGIAVSFGVGQNPAKRLAEPFEAELLRGLLRLGLPILVDQGAGGEEAERVRRAIEGSGAAPGRITSWDGAFAPFAARIRESRLYVGYDSAGQHVAAAARVPFVSVFAGAPCERFVQRWRPTGLAHGCVLRAGHVPPKALVGRVIEEARRLAGG